jgi:RNA polymerase sigma-70 factor (ECF subfamily)
MNTETPLASIEALLAEARWLRRLARSLVDDGDAEDVVQETYTAAIADRPEGDRPVRPWLARVLRNFVFMGRRGRRRRVQTEQHAVFEPVPPLPTPEELLLQRQRQRLVAETIEALDEPYRSTLLLCYAEGLTSSEIARRQRLPAATVRARLRRGLAQAREGLDQRHDGDRRRWCAALAPLAAPLTHVRTPRPLPATRTEEVLSMKPWHHLLALTAGGGLLVTAAVKLHAVDASSPVPLAVVKPAPARPTTAPRWPSDATPERVQRKRAPFVGAALPALAAAAHERTDIVSRDAFIDECVARRQKLAACKETMADNHTAPTGSTPAEANEHRQRWVARYERAGRGPAEDLRAICARDWDAGGTADRPRPTRSQVEQIRACWDQPGCATAIACAKTKYAQWTPPSAPDPTGENAEHPGAVADSITPR